MAFAKGTIYAVATYLKHNDGRCGAFHIYTKQTSNLDVMTEYYEEQAARHGDDRVVVLVPRETAKKMHDVWYHSHINIGRVMSREQKMRSILGHGEVSAAKLRRLMSRR